NKKYPPSCLNGHLLTDLSIESWSHDDLSHLGGLPKLRRLRFEKGSLRSLEGIERLTELSKLDIRYCRNLEDVSAITHSALEVLDLYNLLTLEVVSPLANTRALNEITLDRIPRASDWIALFGLRTLRALTAKEVGNALGLTLRLDQTPEIE